MNVWQNSHEARALPLWLGQLHARLRDLSLPVLCARNQGLLSVSLEIPVPEIEAPSAERMAWMYLHRPDEKLRLLGLGEAWTREAWGEARFVHLAHAQQDIQANWVQICHGSACPKARMFIAFAFDAQTRPKAQWSSFENSLLLVPKLLLEWRRGRCHATFSGLCRGRKDHAEALLRQWMGYLYRVLNMASVLPLDAYHNACLEQHVSPDDAAWKTQVWRARQIMAKQALKKVVLARYMHLRFRHTVAHDVVMARLARDYPHCQLVSVSRQGKVLLAATPERLLRLHDDKIYCDALAGTSTEPAALPESSMAHWEHRPVIEAIETVLRPFCSRLYRSQTYTPIRLRSFWHLRTRIEGRLKTDCDPLFALLEGLHPTPAVGGQPKALAQKWIRQTEAFERGWYTGVVGWLGEPGEADLSVVLRCALIEGRNVYLYAGAGITPVSEPERELQETYLKFSPMLEALGVTS